MYKLELDGCYIINNQLIFNEVGDLSFLKIGIGFWMLKQSSKSIKAIYQFVSYRRQNLSKWPAKGI